MVQVCMASSAKAISVLKRVNSQVHGQTSVTVRCSSYAFDLHQEVKIRRRHDAFSEDGPVCSNLQ
eukprot:3328552-Amphidinium_carterae.1